MNFNFLSFLKLSFVFILHSCSKGFDFVDISHVNIATLDNQLNTDSINDIIVGHKETEPHTNETTYPEVGCFDLHRTCSLWAAYGECTNNPGYMHEKCAYSCNTCSEQSLEFREKNCINKWEEDGNDINDCYEWAKEGYCKTDTFMHVYCRRSCNFCDFERRCKPYNYYPSALNLNNYSNPNLYFRLFFNGILGNKFLRWKYGVKLVNLDPPVLYFDSLIPETVADKFIIENADENYKRSVDVVGTNDDGSIVMSTSQGRTSKNAWCGYECQNKNSTKVILESMEELTGIPRNHYENLQMLIYDKTGYYHYHHDFIKNQGDGLAGGRILTFFLYLNNVEIGGETKFPQLKLKVKPKKGSAILWPNVKNNDMYKIETKTHHTALPVIKGRKYGANAWLHLHDWEYAVERDCTS